MGQYEASCGKLSLVFGLERHRFNYATLILIQGMAFCFRLYWKQHTWCHDLLGLSSRCLGDEAVVDLGRLLGLGTVVDDDLDGVVEGLIER